MKKMQKFTEEKKNYNIQYKQTLFLNWKNQFCKDITSSQIWKLLKCNSDKNIKSILG